MASDGVHLSTLTRDRASALAPSLLEMVSDQPWSSWTEENLLAERPQKWARSLIAENSTGVVGWAVASKATDSIHLHHLVVAPKHRGKRVGSQLIAQLLRQAGEEGTLTLKVHRSSERVVGLYERHGFGVVAPRGGEYVQMAARWTPVAEDLRVAVHQPNYLPWGGYFAKMFKSDRFVFLDDAQYPKGSYVNRVKVARGREGEQWLSIPVSKAGKRPIRDVEVADPSFAGKHLRLLRNEYAHAPYLDEVLELVQPLLERATTNLSGLNSELISRIARYLGWGGRFVTASEHPSELTSDQRVAELVRAAGGRVYVSGAGAQDYQSEAVYADWEVRLEVARYGMPAYGRGDRPFVPALSVIDSLMYHGPEAIATLALPSLMPTPQV